MRRPFAHGITQARMALAAAIALAIVPDASAQLISPGKLASAHLDLEGVTGCVNCHQLRKRGVANAKCLECHSPLRTRIARGTGFHATDPSRNCGDCHKDHLGAATDIVRLDTAAFEHAEVGFELQSGHAELGCRDCHAASLIVSDDVRVFKSEHGSLDRTFLGLGTTCLDCHRTDDPHRAQFVDQPCDACHGPRDWKSTERFNHASTRYPLTGRHRRVACTDCHEATPRLSGSLDIQFRPVAFETCQDCHEDTHRGRMGADCTRCHSTAGWVQIDRRRFETGFDHTATQFPLVGKHVDVECQTCHAASPARTGAIAFTIASETRRRNYPLPVVDDCRSCHVDAHQGVFAELEGGVTCDNCHDNDGWVPTTYDLGRHNRSSEYPLTGAHVATPCSGCHGGSAVGSDSLVFAFPAMTCATCHSAEDPHQSQFPDVPCERCHTTLAFERAEIDHDQTRYPLDGAHRPVACRACHTEETTDQGTTFTRYRPLATECRACHG